MIDVRAERDTVVLYENPCEACGADRRDDDGRSFSATTIVVVKPGTDGSYVRRLCSGCLTTYQGAFGEELEVI